MILAWLGHVLLVWCVILAGIACGLKKTKVTESITSLLLKNTDGIYLISSHCRSRILTSLPFWGDHLGLWLLSSSPIQN